MSHDYHEGQPNYHPDQVLKDGCRECAVRSADPVLVLAHLDLRGFVLAWKRAIDFENGRLDNASETEVTFLKMLWGMSVKFREIRRPELVLKLLELR